MTTDIRFFNDDDWKKNKRDFIKATTGIKQLKEGTQFKTQRMFIYFDDDRIMWQVMVVGRFGDKIMREFYYWDDLSTFINKNI